MVEFNQKFSHKQTMFMIAYALAPIVFAFVFVWNGYEFKTLNNVWKTTAFFGIFLYILVGYIFESKIKGRPQIRYALKDRILGLVLASVPLFVFIWLKQQGCSLTLNILFLFVLYFSLIYMLYKKYLKGKERRVN